MRSKNPLKLKEKDVQRQILEWLNLKGHFAWRNNSGAMVSEYKGKKRFMRFGLKGSSDIIGCLTDGRCLAIEVKSPGKAPDMNQVDFLQRISARHGVAFYADSLDDVIKVLEE